MEPPKKELFFVLFRLIFEPFFMFLSEKILNSTMTFDNNVLIILLL